MKKLLIALTAAASAFGLYADVAIGGAGFDSVDAAPLTWTAGDGFAANWSGTDGTMTLTSGDCGKTSVNRPAGFSVTDRDGYMALKTTLGSPVLQNVKASGSAQPIDDGFFYDGLVQFTAFDETPEMAAYSDAKIGIFPMLENPDSETAYLWVYANGGTNLWKTTTEIDGAWHRVTIKMIKNVTRTADAVNAGFVVFVDGSAVACENKAGNVAFDGLDLNPAALAYFNNGQLFRSLAPTANEFTGVAYDGQGLLDEVGFTDLAGAPEFALDENWKSLAWNGSTIAEVYLWEKDGDNDAVQIDTLTASPADFVADSGKTYYYSYKAASTGYMDQTELVKIEGAQVTITDPKTCAAKVNGVGYETIGAALDVIYDATDAQELVLCANVEESISIDTQASVVLDLAGFNITAGAEEENAIYSNCELTITDTTEDPGVISGGTSEAIYVGYSLTIEGGIIDGYVNENAGQGEMLEYTLFKGGKVSVDENVTADGECTIPTEPDFIAKAVTGYWEVVADTRFTVTVEAAVEHSTIASIVVDGEPVAEPAAGDFLAETSVVVTYAANTGYKFIDPTQAEQTLTEEGSTTAPAVEALPIVAYIAAVPYYTLGAAIDAVDGETIVLADNYTMTADETKEFAKNATLDLNGKTLTVPTAIRNKKSATAGDNGSFGVLESATVTFQNGAIDLAAEDTEGSGYGIAVYGTLNANCTITREGSAAGPIFDIFGATVNAQAAADLTSTGDVFRFKDEDVTSTVTVVAGAKAEATGAQPIFYNYKKGHTANITITGGQFKQTGTGAIFGGAKDYTQMIWNVTKMDATPAFNTASIENAYAKDMVIPNQKAVLGTDEWYHLADAIKVTTLTVAEGATLTGVALGDKFAAGETVAFTVTADDETVKVIDTVTVNSETLTAPYSWTVPATLPEAIAIVVTVKDPAPVNPVIDPTHPTVDVPVTITTKEDALDWAEANVKVATPDDKVVSTDDYTAYFKFTVSGDAAPFTVAAELKDDVVKAEAETAEVLTDVLALTDSGEISLTNAKPGLYYTLKQGNTLEGSTAGASERATSEGVKLDATKWADAGFYQIIVSKEPLDQGN